MNIKSLFSNKPDAVSHADKTIVELFNLNGVYNLTDTSHPMISEIDSIFAKKFKNLTFSNKKLSNDIKYKPSKGFYDIVKNLNN